MAATIYIIGNIMETIKIKDNKAIVTIPKKLYMAIVRIQGKEDYSFEDACNKVALLTDIRQKDFEKAVNVEADRRYKSAMMSQVNKAKKTIGEKKYDEGYDNGYHDKQSELTIPCNICYQKIILSDDMWESASEYLISKKWIHAKCQEQNY